MGVKLAVLAVGLALVASPAEYVAAHQQSDGGFAEAGQSSSDPNLTAWAVLGLVAAGKAPGRSAGDYLAGAPATSANDVALRILALDALGRNTDSFATRLEAMRRPDGRIGTLVNSTIWGVLALRAAGAAGGHERPLPAPRPAPERGMGLVSARSGRFERHRGGDRGAAGGGRRPEIARDHEGPRLSPPAADS